jgi:t-SNARE complex subunit (syntaxin)
MKLHNTNSFYIGCTKINRRRNRILAHTIIIIIIVVVVVVVLTFSGYVTGF